jgi:protein CMS1
VSVTFEISLFFPPPFQSNDYNSYRTAHTMPAPIAIPPQKTGGDDLDDGLELDPNLLASSDVEDENSDEERGELDEGEDLGESDDGEGEGRTGGTSELVDEEDGGVPEGTKVETVGSAGDKKRKASPAGEVDDAAEKKRRKKEKEKERKARVGLRILPNIRT